MKYNKGTVLKWSPKALRALKDEADPYDRMVVVNEKTVVWYSTRPQDNTEYNGPIIPAYTVLQMDMFKTQDSHVTLANEMLPKLVVYKCPDEEKFVPYNRGRNESGTPLTIIKQFYEIVELLKIHVVNCTVLPDKFYPVTPVVEPTNEIIN